MIIGHNLDNNKSVTIDIQRVIELAEKSGFSVEGGTFNTYLSELRRNGLIKIKGEDIIATKELFPMEVSI